MTANLPSGITRKGALAGAIFLVLALVSTEAQAQAAAFHGHLSTHYRLRATADDTDQDLYQYLGLDLGDPMKDPMSFHLFARGAFDLDGETGGEEYQAFRSLNDSSGEDAVYDVYYAYLDFHNLSSMKVLRLGRQSMFETPVIVVFDGAWIETREEPSLGRLKIGAYGGVPVNFWESYENNDQKDSLYGAYASARPWRGGRVEVQWVHVIDEYLYGEETDDFYSLGGWQALGKYAQVHAQYTRWEDEDHDVSAYAMYYSPEADLLIQASYYRLLAEEQNRSVLFDTFYAATREFQPYWQARLVAVKGLGEAAQVEAGVDSRQLDDDADAGNYNHEFIRYWGALYVTAGDVTVSGTGEVWDSEDQLEKIETYGADVTYKPSREFSVSAGTYYDLYKYDYYLNEEEHDIQTYYGKLRYKPREGLGGGVIYEYEDDDYDDYQTLRVELSYYF